MSMMKTYLPLLFIVLCCRFGNCVQPYFPEQIVFRVDQYGATYAIDQVNQRAFRNYSRAEGSSIKAIAMVGIPYTTPDSPQAKYMTELVGNGLDFNKCNYASYWAYGGKQYSEFPEHWHHGTSFEIGTYMKFLYNLTHSTNSSVDHWYSNEQCMTTFSGTVQCEEIFFEKDTEIPIQYNYMYSDSGYVYQGTKQFFDVVVGEPDKKYFQTIPQDWTSKCTDLNLDFEISDNAVKLGINETAGISLWLTTPPHQINGNDTTTIEWTVSAGCTDCVTWQPKQFVFNSQNFMEKQTLTITRIKIDRNVFLSSVNNGGGFDDPSHIERILID